MLRGITEYNKAIELLEYALRYVKLHKVDSRQCVCIYLPAIHIELFYTLF
jgi:hypothetical protein